MSARVWILSCACLGLMLPGCTKKAAPRELHGPPVPKGFTALPPAPPPRRLPEAGATSAKLRWLGPALDVGEWETVPAMLLVTGWRADPGDDYRARLRWPGGQSADLCLIVGDLDSEEGDLDDAKELLRSCAQPNADGIADATVHVPSDGNMVLMRFHGHGNGPPNLDVRIDPSKG